MAKRFRSGYYACDSSPENFKYDHAETHKLDICSDEIDQIGTFDYIIHNHILQTITCNPLSAIAKLDKLLNPGGIHLFTIPFRGTITRESLDTNLSPAERQEAFGSSDHLRVFGTVDFPRALSGQRGVINPKFPMLSRFSKSDLERYRIPSEDHSKVTGGTVFFYQAPA